MRNNDLESIFKNQFKGHKESIDAQEMIQRLNLDQPKKKRKSIVFQWISISCALIITCIILFLNNSQIIIIAEGNNHSSKQATIENKNIDISGFNTVKQIEENKYFEEKANTLLVDNILKQRKDFSKLSELKINENNKLISLNQIILPKKNITINDSHENEILNVNPNINKPIKIAIVNKSQTNKQYENESSQNLIECTEISIMEENYLDLSPYVRANISALKLNTYPEEKENSTIESNFLLSTYIGVKIVHRTLNSSTQEYNSFVELRNQNEKQLEAIQMGFSISKSINKYLYLKTGLEHTQINEKSIINYTTNNFSVDDDFPILLQIQSNGDTIINNGSAIINTPSLHTQTEYNNHKFITIPINLGTKGEFNKLEWFLEAGLLANLYMGFYGEMMFPQYVRQLK